MHLVPGTASMRPRFMNRGSPRTPNLCRTCIRGFNEAPIHESGKCAGGRRPCGTRLRASMRPRFMNRGSVHLVDVAGARHRASMRPRFMNRGSVGKGRNTTGPRRASMRPRFMNRGSSVRAGHPQDRGVVASMRPRFMNRGSRGRS